MMPRPTFSRAGARQVATNRDAWQKGNFVREYASRVLAPGEVLLLSRYREPLSGRTLELGCGAGRVLGYLAALGQEAHGVDVSPLMVDYCRRTYPRAHVRVGDIAHPASCGEGPFDAVWATSNVLDVFDDANRRRVLGELADLIGSNGILIFSSHNLDAVPPEDAPAIGRPSGRAALDLRGSLALARATLARATGKPPATIARRIAGLPARRRNRRALAPLVYRGDGYAVLNDEAHDYALLHYYIRRDDQERQLAELGYVLTECLDAAGEVVAPGQLSRSSELHYVAYPR
jgi:SAM-dependent methyltransferase